LASLKVDVKNTLNECEHSAFFACVSEDFPEIFVWINWWYSQSAELLFGNRQLLASSGVQQGDPLGPLLFFTCNSLMLLNFVSLFS